MTKLTPEQPTFQRILAADTATRTQALALLDGDLLLEHSQRRVKFNHGSSLLAHVAAMLDSQALSLQQLDLIAVGLGPGSFTGLRVGLAAAKSLARAHQIPLVGVSTLAATAHPLALAHPKAAVCCALDARRGEVYAGVYELAQPGAKLRALHPDHTTTCGDLRARLLKLADTRPVILLSDAADKYAELNDFPTSDVLVLPSWAAAPPALSVALLGRQKAQAGKLDDIAQLEPNYIRPTDAEIKFG